MLDGSYEIRLNSNQNLSDIQVKAEVFGIQIFDGTVEDFGSKNRWSLSAHTGYTFPIGNFSNTHTSGWASEIDIEYEINKLWSVELVGGLNSFNGKSGIDNINIAGGTLYIKKRFSGQSLQPYIAVGPGFYSVSDSSSYFGLSPGVGFIKQLNSKWSAEIGMSYFWLIGNSVNLHFRSAKIGFKYKL